MHPSLHPAALAPPTVHRHSTGTTTPRPPRTGPPSQPKPETQPDVPFHLWPLWHPPTAVRPPRRPPRKTPPSGCAGCRGAWPWRRRRRRAPSRRTEAHRRVRQAPLGGHYRGRPAAARRWGGGGASHHRAAAAACGTARRSTGARVRGGGTAGRGRVGEAAQHHARGGTAARSGSGRASGTGATCRRCHTARGGSGGRRRRGRPGQRRSRSRAPREARRGGGARPRAARSIGGRRSRGGVAPAAADAAADTCARLAGPLITYTTDLARQLHEGLASAHVGRRPHDGAPSRARTPLHERRTTLARRRQRRAPRPPTAPPQAPAAAPRGGGGSTRGPPRPWRHGRRTAGRSEERRVGKECRSRWSPDH